jgi:hypothetical protein
LLEYHQLRAFFLTAKCISFTKDDAEDEIFRSTLNYQPVAKKAKRNQIVEWIAAVTWKGSQEQIVEWPTFSL